MKSLIIALTIVGTSLALVIPGRSFACGRQFFLALSIEQNNRIQEDPAAFVSQTQAARTECVQRSKSRNEAGQASAMDVTLLHRLQDCEEIRDLAHLGGGDSEITNAACVFVVLRHYSWDLVMERTERKD